MLGFHIPRIQHSTEKSVEAIQEMVNETCVKMQSIQIFAVGPQNHNEVLNSGDIEYLRSCPYKVVIHGAYIDNPWNSAPGTIHNIKKEFGIMQSVGGVGLIVHLSGAAGEHKHKIVSQLDLEKFRDCVLFLENNAMRSGPLSFETPDKINAFFADLRPKYIKLGLCLDTAHLYSCGVSLKMLAEAKAFLRGLKVPHLMFHLNDSGAEFGSGKDLHEPLTHGNIWRKGDGYQYILKYAKKKNLIVILERHQGEISKDLNLLESFCESSL